MANAPNGSGGDQKTKIWQLMKKEPHRAFLAGDLARALNAKVAKKESEEKQKLVKEITGNLDELVEEGVVRMVADGLFKYRLFTNDTKFIEQAFIGGMGNTLFYFQSTIFRLNIGVLSIFFTKNQKENNWSVLVQDMTGGTSFCLRNLLTDGNYTIGSEEKEEEGYITIAGRYIEDQHVSIAIKGNDIQVEDQKTGTGSRVDLLTEEGLGQYGAAADEFIKTADPVSQWHSVNRGRYVLDQLLENKQNFETNFFGAMVDAKL